MTYPEPYRPSERKPPIIIRPVEMHKECRVCGAGFVTVSKLKVRCDPCQKALNKLRESRAYRKGRV